MKVYISKRIPENGMEILRNANLEILFPESQTESSGQWLANCKKADVLLNVGKGKLDKNFFKSCPNIKAIALFSVGFDNVDVDAANTAGVPVGNTPEVLSRATSDIAFLLMQMVARKVNYNVNKLKSGNWKDFDALEELGQELYGKTLGVYGLGRIGFEMAEKCKNAFNMKVIYHNRSRNEEAEDTLDAKLVSFDELIQNSDVLSIHANYTPAQSEKFNRSVFEKMKPNSIFINTARGGFQNEKDLLQALKNKQIWGAGLDVTNPEPMNENNELLDLPNVCVLPHIGSATVEARNGMAKLAAENIVAFSKGEKMPTCINPEVYDK